MYIYEEIIIGIGSCVYKPLCMCVSCLVVSDSAIPWIVACQASLCLYILLVLLLLRTLT